LPRRIQRCAPRDVAGRDEATGSCSSFAVSRPLALYLRAALEGGAGSPGGRCLRWRPASHLPERTYRLRRLVPSRQSVIWYHQSQPRCCRSPRTCELCSCNMLGSHCGFRNCIPRRGDKAVPGPCRPACDLDNVFSDICHAPSHTSARQLYGP
jgi:hypothetical protein